MASFSNPQYKVGSTDPASAASPWAGSAPQQATNTPGTNPLFLQLGKFIAEPLGYLSQMAKEKLVDPVKNAGGSFKQGFNSAPQGGGFCGSGAGPNNPPGAGSEPIGM